MFQLGHFSETIQLLYTVVVFINLLEQSISDTVLFEVNYIFPMLHMSEIKAEYLFQFIAPDKVALLTLNIFLY